MKITLSLIAAAVAALPGFANAQDSFELSFGAALTSDYIFRGATQTDFGPAIQGYVEGQMGMFYGGVWASNVDFGSDDDDSIEFDIFAGIRSEFNALSIDLNYTRYVYNDSGDCCGNVILVFEYGVTETAATSLELDWDPEFGTYWTEIGASFAYLDNWVFSGVAGSDFGSEDLQVGDKWAWDAGVTYNINDNFWLDGRYYDANVEDPSGVVSVGFDF